MWLPINPTRTSKGAWVSLAKVVGDDKAKPIPLDAGDDPLTSSFTLVDSEIALSVAGKLAVGSIFGGTAGYDEHAFYLDGAAYTEKYAEPAGGQGVLGTRWGVGLRVLLRVKKIKADVNLNFGMVGAAVQLGYASAQYEIQGIGIGIDGLQIVLGALGGRGDFTSETYYKINDAVLSKLADYIKANAAKLKPQPFAVQLIQPIDIDPMVVARPIVFAMRRIREGSSLNDALGRASGKYEETEIKAVYGKISPGSGPDDKPSKDSRNQADNWLSDN